MPEDARHIVITSQHSLKVLQEQMDKMLYCVGKETAELAEEIGFQRIIQRPTVAELTPFIPQNALYVRGTDISQPLPQCRQHIAYRAVPTDTAPKDITAVVLCSNRGARICADLLDKPLPAFCLSRNIAETYALHQNGQHVKTYVAKQPNRLSLKNCIEHEYR